jgi:hypothetical protein
LSRESKNVRVKATLSRQDEEVKKRNHIYERRCKVGKRLKHERQVAEGHKVASWVSTLKRSGVTGGPSALGLSAAHLSDRDREI